MAFLSPEPITLHGGCFCKAIRYTINIPDIEQRPIVPDAVDTRIPPALRTRGGQNDDGSGARIDEATVPSRFPVVGFDHCQSCRTISGAVVQCWLICPMKWVKWDLLPRESNQTPSYRHHHAPGDGDGDGESDNVADHASPASSESEKRWLDLPSIDVVVRETRKNNPTPNQTPAPTTTTTSTTATTEAATSYMNYLHSTDKVTRTFCSRCSTGLTFFFDRPASSPMPPIVDIAVGSLDSESLSAVHPDRHGWWASGVPWVQKLLRDGDQGLMRHPTGNLASVLKDWGLSC